MTALVDSSKVVLSLQCEHGEDQVKIRVQSLLMLQLTAYQILLLAARLLSYTGTILLSTRN